MLLLLFRLKERELKDVVGRKAKKARPGSGGRRHNCECDGANLLINNSNRRERKTTAARKEREKENSRAE